MRKKQVAFYLYEEEHAALKGIARNKGVTVNELISINVKAMIAKEGKKK